MRNVFGFLITFMKVILLKEVPKLGKIGDIKEVNVGYGRNFLIPGDMAVLATKHSINMLKNQKRKKERQAKQYREAKQKLAKKIGNNSFIINAKADEKGSLYASLSASKLAEELQVQGYAIEPEEIKLKEKIKKCGKFKAELTLGGKKIKIKLDIKNK